MLWYFLGGFALCYALSLLVIFLRSTDHVKIQNKAVVM